MADVCGVGPYLLQNVLGKGQTGVVKMGVHTVTNKKVAVKIVDKSKIQASVLSKVEREITIMKLIEHHNVLQLYDVYESKKNLFLVLEYVGGGELFEYLVQRGRLHVTEARKFFRQIVSAVNYCHEHLICHRDLKPENLLLDEKQNIKIADFGMASVQVENYFLETSCGSPHYACPEVVRGIPYDGRKADIWSCGVILYALIVGCLPFDDDNLRVLLEKVKRGTFTIPPFVPDDCEDLIKKMIVVNPEKRFNLSDVQMHSFFTRNADDFLPEPPICPVVVVKDLASQNDLDIDVVSSMTCLGCFKDEEKLVNMLLNSEKNAEKIIYFLLLDRKLRKPAKKDDENALIYAHAPDAPQKRIDSPLRSKKRYSQGYDHLRLRPRGSSATTTTRGGRRPSSQVFEGSMFNSLMRRPRAFTVSSANGSGKKTSPTKRPNSEIVSPPGSPWGGRKRIYTFTKSIFNKNGEPVPVENRPSSPTQPDVILKKSWFPGSLFHVDYTGPQIHEINVKNLTFAKLKADFIHTLLIMPKVTHIPVSNSRFKLEYRRNKGRSWLRAQSLTMLEADITKADESSDEKAVPLEYKVVMKFISGSHRKYRKLCQKIHGSLIKRSKYRSKDFSPTLSRERFSNGDAESLGSSGDLITPDMIREINNSIMNLKMNGNLKATVL